MPNLLNSGLQQSSQNKMTKDVPYLNGLRGFAAIWVVVSHCMIWGGWTLTPIPDPKIAVDLFMLISGFLMAMNARQRENIEPMQQPRTWVAFYSRRFFRLAPAYYLTLFIAAISSAQFLHGYKLLQLANPGFWAQGGPYDPDRVHYSIPNLLAHSSFMFGISPGFMNSTMLPDWSLSLEMQFYLAFPFIYLLARKFGSVAMAVLLSLLTGAATISLHGTFAEASFLPLKLSLFVTGMMLADLQSKQIPTRRALGILALSVGLPLFQLNDYGRQLPILLMMCALFATLSIPALSGNAAMRGAKIVLGSRPAHVLSEASYGIYLFHGFLISLCGQVLFAGSYPRLQSGNGLTLVMWLVVVPGSFAVAMVVNKTIERYGIMFGRRFFWGKRRTP